MSVSGGLGKRHSRRLRALRGIAMVAAVSVAMLGGTVVTATSASAEAGKVWVCHATSSDLNPYRIINVSVGSTKHEGHLKHATNPKKTWQSTGTFGAVPHVAGQAKPDIIGEPGAEFAPEKCGASANASLTLEKKVSNSDVSPSKWLLHATSEGTSFAGTTGTAGATQAVADGTYALSETGGPTIGFTDTGWKCSNSAVNGTTVTIGADDTDVTCTITNTYAPPPKPQMVNLSLVKSVVNSNASPSLWTLHADSVPAGTSFEGKTGTPSATHAVPLGTYNLSESGGPTTGFSNTGWTCPGATMSDSDTVVIGALNSVASDNVATVRTVTCTITNTFTPPVRVFITPDAPAISLVKVATLGDTNRDGVANAGESILYTFKVTNIGNVVLTTIAVVDPLLDSAPGSAVTCAPTTLLPGGTATCTAAAFLVTPANATGADIVNVATASGQPPTGSRVEATDKVETPTGGAVEEVVTVAPGNVPAIVPVKVVKGAVVTKATVSPAKVTALAFTGAETVPLGLSGLLALLLGAGLVAIARRQGRRANN